MLGYENIEEVQVDLYDIETKQLGFLDWEEFLDFFLIHSSTKEENSNPWWKKLLREDEEKANKVIVD